MSTISIHLSRKNEEKVQKRLTAFDGKGSAYLNSLVKKDLNPQGWLEDMKEALSPVSQLVEAASPLHLSEIRAWLKNNKVDEFRFISCLFDDLARTIAKNPDLKPEHINLSHKPSVVPLISWEEAPGWAFFQGKREPSTGKSWVASSSFVSNEGFALMATDFLYPMFTEENVLIFDVDRDVVGGDIVLAFDKDEKLKLSYLKEEKEGMFLRFPKSYETKTEKLTGKQQILAKLIESRTL